MQREGATLRCGLQASHCGGFSCCRAQALGSQASVVVARRLSSCDLRALERRLSSCGARAQLLYGMWDLPGPGIEPVSHALAGGFLTTAHQGSPTRFLFKWSILRANPRYYIIVPVILEYAPLTEKDFIFNLTLQHKIIPYYHLMSGPYSNFHNYSKLFSYTLKKKSQKMFLNAFLNM